MKVHMVCETPFGMKGNGVYTAFVDSLELLREKGDVEIVVNGEGQGDVFHSHTYRPYYFWKGKKYKGKRVFTAHNDDELFWLKLINTPVFSPVFLKFHVNQWNILHIMNS